MTAPCAVSAQVTTLTAAVMYGDARQLVARDGRVVALTLFGRVAGDATDIVAANPGAFYRDGKYVIPTIGAMALTCENGE